MNITIDLLQIVERAHSLTRILDAATRIIAERLRVDGCSVFLLDEHGDLDDDIFMQLGQLAAFGDHAVHVRGDHLGADRPGDDLADRLEPIETHGNH